MELRSVGVNNLVAWLAPPSRKHGAQRRVNFRNTIDYGTARRNFSGESAPCSPGARRCCPGSGARIGRCPTGRELRQDAGCPSARATTGCNPRRRVHPLLDLESRIVRIPLPVS
jgi:hypothetical protein